MTRILIIDDSALIRKILSNIFAETPDIEVVGTAADPLIARDKIKKLNPDVLTLDVEMPRMDGLTFLRNLMRLRPMPVVMISTLTTQGATQTLKALELGAVDFLPKPQVGADKSLQSYADEIIAKVRMAAKAKVRPLSDLPRQNDPPTLTDSTGAGNKTRRSMQASRPKLIALGASTGGTEAVKVVVRQLLATSPAMVVSQHLPAAFSDSFARHVDQATAMTACIAGDGQEILPGNIYIAPGDQHLQVVRQGQKFFCHLQDGPPVNRHKPAVDVMFRSVAQNVGADAIGVLLTGMGADGAKGMQEMHTAGSATVVQDESSSVVWGMPGEAYKLGCVDHVLALDKIAGKIMALVG